MKEEIMRKISEQAQEKLGIECNIKFDQVEKNNGVVLKSVIINEPGLKIAPQIYIDRFIEGLENGTATVGEVVDYIVESYKKGRQDGERFKAITSCLTKEAILNNVTYQVVNREKNMNRLQQAPFKIILDLAALYRVVVSKSGEGNASFLVSNSLMEMYGISINELEEAAKKNTEGGGFIIRTLAGVLHGKEQAPEEQPQMYILTNKEMINGAAVILYESYFQHLADVVKEDLIIIPSSIHEVLAVPDDGKVSVNDIKNMVKEINNDVVSEQEILSYSVYKYSREEGKLMIV